MALQGPITPSSPWKSELADLRIGNQSIIDAPGIDTSPLTMQVANTIATGVFQALVENIHKTTHATEVEIEIRYIGNEVHFFQVDHSGPREVTKEITFERSFFEEDCEKLIATAAKVDTFTKEYIRATTPEPKKDTPPAVDKAEKRLEGYRKMGIAGKGMSPRVLQGGKTLPGLRNGTNACYANAATQLFRHVDSLREEVTDKLGDTQRNAILSATTGEDVLKATRPLCSTPAEALVKGRGYDSGDFYSVLLGQVKEKSSVVSSDSGKPASKVYAPMQVSRSYVYDPAKMPVSGTEEEKELYALQQFYYQGDIPEDHSFESRERLPSYSLGLSLSKHAGKHVKFSDAFKGAIMGGGTDEPLRRGNMEFEQVGEAHMFTEAPSQLFIRAGRFNGGKDARELVDTPYIFNPKDFGALQEGVEGKPLELKGFIVHGGTGTGIVGGHYVSYFQKEGVWYFADDSQVREVSVEDVAYAMMYASDLYYDDKLSEHGQKQFEMLEARKKQYTETRKAAEETPTDKIKAGFRIDPMESAPLTDTEIDCIIHTLAAVKDDLDKKEGLYQALMEANGKKYEELSDIHRDAIAKLEWVKNITRRLPKDLDTAVFEEIGKKEYSAISVTFDHMRSYEVIGKEAIREKSARFLASSPRFRDHQSTYLDLSIKAFDQYKKE